MGYRLTKSTYFIPVKSTYSAKEYARIYINEVVSLHGIHLSIISDRGARFTSWFWRSFQKGLGTQVKLSTTFHPQTDGQAERAIQTLEDILRACVIDIKGNWDEHLSLVEFSYNNSYHSSISMLPFESLYGRIFRSPVWWFEIGESSYFCHKLIYEALEKVHLIRNRLKTDYNRQKSYVDNRKRYLEFEEGYKVYLKISPM